MPASLAGSLTTTLAATAAQSRASRSIPSRSPARHDSTLTGPFATPQIAPSSSRGSRPAWRAASASSAALVVTPLVALAATQAPISAGSALSTKSFTAAEKVNTPAGRRPTGRQTVILPLRSRWLT